MSTTLLTPSNLKTVRFEISGFNEYLEKIQKAGRNIDEVVAEAIEKSIEPILEDISAWAEKHKMTGATMEGVAVSGVQHEGNKTFVQVGIDSNKSENSWHAVFIEYGTPTTPADPGIRTAFSGNKRKVIEMQKDVLTKGGIQVG